MYSISKIKELVYSDLYSNISEMLDNWKLFFSKMKSLKIKLEDMINKVPHTINKYSSNPTKRYVFANKIDKENLWDQLSILLFSEKKIPHEVSRRIYIDQCQLIFKRSISESNIVDIETQFQVSTFELLKQILEKSKSINMNIIKAIKKVADSTGEDTFNLLKDEISIVDRLSNPYIYTISNQATSVAYLAIHPSSYDELNEFENIEVIKRPYTIIKNENFSPFEIVIYRSVYGLYSQDINNFIKVSNKMYGYNKFYQNSGSYNKFYQNLIDQLEKGRKTVVTPHLDKRWHLPEWVQILIDDK